MTLKSGVTLYVKASLNSNKLAEIDGMVVLKLSSSLVTDGWADVKSEPNDLNGFVSAINIWGI